MLLRARAKAPIPSSAETVTRNSGIDRNFLVLSITASRLLDDLLGDQTELSDFEPAQ
jgi:hypothetical protein